MNRKITRKRIEKFLKRYQTNKRVLDVGSGGSSYDRYFPNRITVDIDPGRGPHVIGDAHNLPFNDGEFDVVLCTEVLEHVKNPFDVEREFRRVLKSGGMLILTTRFVFPLHDVPNDYWRFTKYGLVSLFSEWDIVELSAETGTFSTIAALLQRISFQTVLRFNKLSKGFIFILVTFFNKLDGLIKNEYGDIKRISVEQQIMATGYHLVARRK